jgi:hypothetical protein
MQEARNIISGRPPGGSFIDVLEIARAGDSSRIQFTIANEYLR